ncbi:MULTISPECIES: hypothetical protein [Streptomyces]|uniref:Uncharacterized protein n=1 Tax=Streptomyces cinereoruber TaxID=67260 RepID=A0ABX6BMZ0_9ACTN|nr:MULTISPECIES: hypothetical protein [Streptomyces]AVH93965.1 hypothetical protein C5L38_01865 [Streptomyces sp. WAC00288]KYG51611.1 hypothetical protein AWI43_29860 [Streptomyces sp. WAC04657]MBB4161303.1 hypothetical protein [Streptomyces cinereoruber]MBY8819836.1 hypothetical protein [Streptomyces cinereoruber]NIH63681.1 hypothetical protein [Streptomyces cinereoruber]
MSDVYDLHIDTDVTVQLSDCDREDAQAVFGVLDAVYRLEDMTTSAPQAATGPSPTVWTATFDTAGGEHREVSPARLSAMVGVTLTGGYHAVDEVEKVLATGFDVQSRHTVSGDQETEARLLLASR